MNPILSVSAAVQLHTPQKSPKIASSVCFDSAHRRIIPNMITHNCSLAAKCARSSARTVILLNRNKQERQYCPQALNGFWTS